MSRRLSTEDCINRFMGVHGNTYDYSKVIYKNCDSKVIIGCKLHGDFLQSPYCHQNGQGCPKCGGTLKWDTGKFVEAARGIHGDTYDYSHVCYVNCDTPVKILCSIHGEFLQRPEVHLRGAGCPKCAHATNADNCRSNAEEFIEKAKEVHGNEKYDYSRVHYVNCKVPVEILCKNHGPFFQTPNEHLGGGGCIECWNERRALVNRLTQDEFVEKAVKVHGEKYDYSDAKYVTSNTKVNIKCNKCGHIFSQVPFSHLRGAGCPLCGKERTFQSLILTQEECLQQFVEAHGDRYDYSRVVYGGDKSKVEVICRVHGSFWTSPCNHKNGGGCPKCVIEGRIKDITGFRSGKLVVTKFAHTKNQKAYWYAQCDCGSPPKIYPEQALTRPEMTTKSCGNCGYKKSILREVVRGEHYRSLMREINTLRYMKIRMSQDSE